jgi:hypothetical protein
MKKLLLLLVFTSGLFAQNAPNLTFANKENNVGFGGNLTVEKTVKDASGNNYLFGRFYGITDFDPSIVDINVTASNFQFGDMFIAKYNSNGDFLWVKNITGSGYTNCSAVVIGGNFIYIAGKYTSTIDFDPSASTANLTSANGTYEAAYLAKYDLNGAYLSSRSIDGDTNLKINGLNFSNNQLFVSGNYSGAVDFDSSTNTLNLISNGGTDIFIAKYSTLFAPLWVYSIGGVGNDICNSQAVTSTGEVIITGSYLNTVDFDPSTATNTLVNTSSAIQNTYIAKYSTSGAYVWAKDIGGRRSGTVGPIPVVALDASNNILVAGIFTSTSDFDPSATVVSIIPTAVTTFVAKYDGNGNYVWVKTLNDITNNKGLIINNSNNNITIFGTFSSSTTADFDPGTPVFNLDTTNGTNYFATYDSNGNFVYAKNMKPTITNVINNDTQGIYLMGNFSGTNDFDPSAGVATQFSVSSNGFIAKYDTAGAYGYVKPIGGNKPANLLTNLISTDGAGNIYRVGTLSATTDLDPSSNTFNVSSPLGTGIFISKYSPSGNFIWGNTMPGSTGTSLSIAIMNTDTNGNTYIAGSADANGVLSSFMLKYDSNGNNLWTKQINGTINATRRIVFDSQGNFYVAGTISGATAIDFDPSPFGTNLLNPNNRQVTYIAKYTPQGEHIWAKTVTQSGSDSYEYLYDFQIKNNSLYVAGNISGSVIIFSPTVSYSNVNDNGFVAQFDLSGNYQNSGVFLGNDPNIFSYSVCTSITFDNDDNYYLNTFFSGPIDFDLSPTSVNNLTSLPNGTGGYLRSTAICKYSSNGTLLWAKQINALNTNSLIYTNTTRSFVNTNNELILTATGIGSNDFDPSTNDFIITTPNVNGAFVSTIFVAKYNKTNGDYIWVNKIDSNSVVFPYSVSMNNNQDLFISGQFRDSADFDLSTGVQTLTSANPLVSDRFWVKYTTNTLGLEENTIFNNYRIYPNPASAELFVSHTQYDVFKITITDITGKILKETTIHANEAIDVKSYPQGMYLIQVESDKEKNTYKFIKK